MSRQSIPQAVLSEELSQALKGRRIKAGLFLTFQFDPGFFEEEVLPVLFDQSFSHTPKIRLLQLEEALRPINHLAVYYDRAGLTAEAQPAKLDYQRLPLRRSRGYFHPKNILLLVENSDGEAAGTSLLVGTMSANLTRSGWWENVEVAHFEEIHQGEKSSLQDDLRELIRRLKREDKTGSPHPALDEIDTFLAHQVAPVKQKTKGGRWRPRLYVGQQPVPEFLQPFIPRQFNLEIISPYFDDTDSASTLRTVIETLKPKATRLCLPEDKDGVALCRPGFFAAVKQLPGVHWARLPTGPLRAAADDQQKQAPRFVHAKLYRFWNREREIFFIGSVNLTQAAHQAGRGGNLETAILFESPSPARLGWWLELLDEDRPGEFRPEKGEDAGVEEQVQPLSLRFDWTDDTLSYFWEKLRGQEPGQAAITAQGVPQFTIAPIQFGEWIGLPEPAVQSIKQLLRSTSLVEVSVDSAAPFRILIQEEGMAQKPSMLLSLTAEEILQYWSLLSPEQREIFMNVRAVDLAKDTQIRLSSINLPDRESMFDRFAGIFHAFDRLEHHITVALETGRENEAVYRLFGQKYDSLPALIDKVAQEEQGDQVNRYVTLLCAQQLLQKLTQKYPQLGQHHRPALNDLQQKLQIIDQVKAGFTFDSPAEREQFFAWFEQMFFFEMPVQGRSR